MKSIPTNLPEVLLLEPKVFGDERGFFFESWNARIFRETTGLDVGFVQDNHSRSARHVLRGIHYQLVKPQGKLVRVVSGAVWDVAVDLRRASPRFGQWTGAELTAENRRQLWIPPGFGHGFVVLSESADFLYKTTEFFIGEFDRGIAWDDSQIGVDWRLGGATPLLSARDRSAPRLHDAQVYDAAPLSGAI